MKVIKRTLSLYTLAFLSLIAWGQARAGHALSGGDSAIEGRWLVQGALSSDRDLILRFYADGFVVLEGTYQSARYGTYFASNGILDIGIYDSDHYSEYSHPMRLTREHKSTFLYRYSIEEEWLNLEQLGSKSLSIYPQLRLAQTPLGNESE
ncbi:hypothetical protein [Vibrio sp. WXL210]|uniref:hypothetical protein n=1 Tax=Vibrio sp. WXL210 TaxID=3450709 RepID=UPI003EC4D439